MKPQWLSHAFCPGKLNPVRYDIIATDWYEHIVRHWELISSHDPLLTVSGVATRVSTLYGDPCQ